MKAHTKTARFKASTRKVFDFVADVDNLPKWATNFCLELTREGADRKVKTPMGEMYFRIDADSRHGIFDMWSGPTPDQMVRWPARVVDDNFGGSVLTVSAIQMPDDSDEQFESQCQSLDEEFENIRQAVE